MSGLGCVRRGKWRGLVGLVAAYALALQAILGLAAVSQASADGLTGDGAAIFALCSHDASADAGAADGAPARNDAHCPLCTLVACTTALTPEAAVSARLFSVASAPLPVPIADAPTVSRYPSSGLSRAPPILA